MLERRGSIDNKVQPLIEQGYWIDIEEQLRFNEWPEIVGCSRLLARQPRNFETGEYRQSGDCFSSWYLFTRVMTPLKLYIRRGSPSCASMAENILAEETASVAQLYKWAAGFNAYRLQFSLGIQL